MTTTTAIIMMIIIFMKISVLCGSIINFRISFLMSTSVWIAHLKTNQGWARICWSSCCCDWACAGSGVAFQTSSSPLPALPAQQSHYLQDSKLIRKVRIYGPECIMGLLECFLCELPLCVLIIHLNHLMPLVHKMMQLLYMCNWFAWYKTAPLS